MDLLGVRSLLEEDDELLDDDDFFDFSFPPFLNHSSKGSVFDLLLVLPLLRALVGRIDRLLPFLEFIVSLPEPSDPKSKLFRVSH